MAKTLKLSKAELKAKTVVYPSDDVIKQKAIAFYEEKFKEPHGHNDSWFYRIASVDFCYYVDLNLTVNCCGYEDSDEKYVCEVTKGDRCRYGWFGLCMDEGLATVYDFEKCIEYDITDESSEDEVILTEIRRYKDAEQAVSNNGLSPAQVSVMVRQLHKRKFNNSNAIAYKEVFKAVRAGLGDGQVTVEEMKRTINILVYHGYLKFKKSPKGYILFYVTDKQ